MESTVEGRTRGAIYDVLRHHGVNSDQRSRLSRLLERYSEHEVHGFFISQRRKGYGPGACVRLLLDNPACIEWEQAMGGKPVPWGPVNEVMLRKIQNLFRRIGLSDKMAVPRDPTRQELDDRRLAAKHATLGQMLDERRRA